MYISLTSSFDHCIQGGTRDGSDTIHRPRDKLQVGQALKALIFWAELLTGQKVKVFCSNGISKHLVGHLPKVPHYTVPLHNASLTHALVPTPEEALSGNKLDVFQL